MGATHGIFPAGVKLVQPAYSTGIAVKSQFQASAPIEGIDSLVSAVALTDEELNVC
jgi:hypothetical protein